MKWYKSCNSTIALGKFVTVGTLVTLGTLDALDTPLLQVHVIRRTLCTVGCKLFRAHSLTHSPTHHYNIGYIVEHLGYIQDILCLQLSNSQLEPFLPSSALAPASAQLS